MAAIRLTETCVEKPWGRTDLGSNFRAEAGAKVGEIWFETDRALPLLVKYIFTSEKLSIQVHPNDEQGVARGFSGGKSECWYVIAAEPDAVIGLGLRQPLTNEKLAASALDGSLEDLMQWRPVRAGSFFYVPAGAIHAIGAGVCLVEVQQNNDVTFRLYDYGRPRELHLEDGVAVSRPAADDIVERDIAQFPATHLVDDKAAPFTLEKISLGAGETQLIAGPIVWFIPLDGGGALDGMPFQSGQCWLIEGEAVLMVHHKTTFLVARPVE